MASSTTKVESTSTSTSAPIAANSCNSKSASNSASRYVPIRPLFRPLLPKPVEQCTKISIGGTSAGTSTTSTSTNTNSTNNGTTTNSIKTTKTTKAAKSTKTCTNNSATKQLSSSAPQPQIKIERRRSDGTDTAKKPKKTKERKPKKRANSQPIAPQTLPSTIAPASLVYKRKKQSAAAAAAAAGANGKSSANSNINSLLNGSGSANALAKPSHHDIVAENAIRPTKLSAKVMLSVGATVDQPLNNSSAFDLNNNTDLYLLGGPSSPSSVVDSVALWESNKEEDLMDLTGVDPNNTSGSSAVMDSASDQSPIDSLSLMDNLENAFDNDSDLTSYSDQLISLESYLTPEPDEGVQEVRDSFSFTAVNS